MTRATAAVFLALLQLRPAQDVSPEQVGKLVEQLSADRVETRNEATRKLRELGDAVLPELQKASADVSPERSARAREILRLIPQWTLERAEAAFLNAKSVTVKCRVRASVATKTERSVCSGSYRLYLKEGNRVRLDFALRGAPLFRDWTFHSDGERARTILGVGDPVPLKTPKNLSREVALAVVRPGLLLGCLHASPMINAGPGRGQEALEGTVDIGARFTLADVRRSAQDENGARTFVYSFESPQGDKGAAEVTLVVDAKSLRPLRRNVTVQEPATTVVIEEIYEEVSFRDDIPDAVFLGDRREAVLELIRTGEEKSSAGDVSGALADLTKAAELDPVSVPAVLSRGEARREALDLAGAIRDFTLAAGLDPADSAAYRERGITRAERREYDAALADLTRAVDLDPGDPVALNERGAVRGWKGDTPGALADFGRSIEIQGRNAAAFTRRGFLHRLAGKSEAAREDFASANDAVHGWPSACLHLASMAYVEGDFRSALKHVEKARDIDAGDGRWVAPAWAARVRLGEGKAAGEMVRKFLKENAKGRGPREEWMGTLLAYLAGSTSESDLLKATANGEPEVARTRRCEARFYAGVRRLADGDEAGARASFEESANSGAKDVLESLHASSELKRLKDQRR